jgi:hypothetical protein
MKKIIFATALFISSFAVKSADAQISLNVNIGSQPDWGPVGYDHVDNYYLPDADAYYNVPTRRFVYLENNTWVRRTTLPARYTNINLYNTYKVVANEPKPWVNHTTYITKYKGYKGRNGQVVIRDSKEAKYVNRSKTKIVKVKGNNGKGHGNGNGKGHGKH